MIFELGGFFIDEFLTKQNQNHTNFLEDLLLELLAEVTFNQAR